MREASSPTSFWERQRNARTATTSVASARGTPRNTLAAMICAGGIGPRISSGGGSSLILARGGSTLERAVVGGAPWSGGAKCGGRLAPDAADAGAGGA